MNFKQWIFDYYTIYRALELKPTTVKSYLSNLSSIPDDWELESVTLLDVQKLINDLALRLSSSSVKHIFQIIREPLENACTYGFPDRRGMLYAIKLPKMRKRLVHSLADQELQKIFSCIYVSDYADVYLTLINTGLRFCELSGLNNSDFSPASGTLKIQRRCYRGLMADGTKTDAGMREIPVSSDMKKLIMHHWSVFSPNMPLFQSKKGDRLSYNTILHEWHRICDRAKICRCGLHVLRHTFATMLLDRNVSLKVVSSLLGHKSITVTADIYCDVSMAMKRAAIAQLTAESEAAAVRVV